ncbi:MAG: amidase [Candidatus Competibacteraceae bacterium]|nr:amidase [Candidatus Competibacteraceae bacterium]
MITDNALWRLSVTELGKLLARGDLTPLDLLATARHRMEAINPHINAIIALDDHAEEAARDSTRRLAAGQPRSALEGIPLTVKDNILVKNIPATWGSRVFADFVPAEDELPIARLRAAGAVILGKTNCPEFTLEGYTDNLLFGVTRNPWQPALTPGGSSGGAVAAVAAGITAAAIGTDGGGSIRRPASHTGLVGFKPSTGRVARVHSLPQILLDFEAIGPLCRTVDDAALLYRHMAGPDPRDRKSLWPVDTPRQAAERLRILYVPRFGAAPLEPQIEASVDSAARIFSALGHEVEQGELPFALDQLNELWPQVGQVGLAYLFERYPQARTLAAPKFIEQAAQGASLPASRYLTILETLDAFRRQLATVYETLDIIMTPSAAALPWPAAQAYPPEIDGEPVGPRGHAVYTAWVNAGGYPGISLPSAPAESGLPIGFQLVAGFGQDELLLELARQYEQAAPWAGRWPELALNATVKS